MIPTQFLHLTLFIISMSLSCFLSTSNIYLFIKSFLGTINSHLSGFYIYSIALILPNPGHSQMLNHGTMFVLQHWVRPASRKKITLTAYLALPLPSRALSHCTYLLPLYQNVLFSEWMKASIFSSLSILPLSSCQLVALSSL